MWRPDRLEWWDPRDWDQDVVNGAKDVGARAVDVTVATVNDPGDSDDISGQLVDRG